MERFANRLPWSEIARLYALNRREESRETPVHYNIAPLDRVLFVHLDHNQQQIIDEGQWGLVPGMVDETPLIPLSDIRAETTADKPMFRDAFTSKRCLIPADGYYEWTASDDGGKDPWFVHLQKSAFSFAGIWVENPHLGIRSCAVLTLPAVEPVSQIHRRMPVILNPMAYDDWLNPATDVVAAKELLADNLNGELEFYRVGRRVNSSKYQENDAIDPV